MERIQSAIAKARAERARRASDGDGAPAVSATNADAWTTLTEVIPDPDHLRRNRIVTPDGGEAAIPFDLLRTRLLRAMIGHGWRRVAIVSPDAGSGKTTLCANLAYSLARQTDTRTVIAEMDMRRPALGAMLGVGRNVQFAEVLKGNGALTDHLLRHGTNLCLALNHAPVSNPSELLQSPNAPRVLDRMEKLLEPDIMLFDMPPLLRSDDTLAFLDKVDCALLIAEAEVTTRQQIDLCEQELARHSTVLGVVLNKLRHPAPAHGYGS